MYNKVVIAKLSFDEPFDLFTQPLEIPPVFLTADDYSKWYKKNQDQIMSDQKEHLYMIFASYVLRKKEIGRKRQQDELIFAFRNIYFNTIAIANGTYYRLVQDNIISPISALNKSEINLKYTKTAMKQLLASVNATMDTLDGFTSAVPYIEPNKLGTLNNAYIASALDSTTQQHLKNYANLVSTVIVSQASNGQREAISSGMEKNCIYAANIKDDGSVQYDDINFGKIILKDTWISERDNRVRQAHRMMDGKTRDNNGDFVLPDGSKCKYPCDPSLPLKLYINCRCIVGQRMFLPDGSVVFV